MGRNDNGPGTCDVDGCPELARYVETGDGHKVSDPDKRCDEHQPSGGLWRDMAPKYGQILTDAGY